MKITPGEAIRLERTRQDKTQAVLAKAAGVTAQTISNWETGQTPIPLPKLVLICKELRIPAADIIKHDRN